MFTSKKVQELAKELEFLKNRVWLLENHPKFKNGDKVYYKNGNTIFFNELVVVGKEVSRKVFMGTTYDVWFYTVLHTAESKLENIYEDCLISVKDADLIPCK